MEIKIICLILCIFSIYCKDLPYVTMVYSSSFYNCMRLAGYDQVIIRLDSDFEDSCIANVLNAKNAGLKVHVFYRLCWTKSLSELGQQLIKYFGNNTLEHVWLITKYQESDR